MMNENLLITILISLVLKIVAKVGEEAVVVVKLVEIIIASVPRIVFPFPFGQRHRSIIILLRNLGFKASSLY